MPVAISMKCFFSDYLLVFYWPVVSPWTGDYCMAPSHNSQGPGNTKFKNLIG